MRALATWSVLRLRCLRCELGLTDCRRPQVIDDKKKDQRLVDEGDIRVKRAT